MKKNIIAIAVMAVASLTASSAFAAPKDDKKCDSADCTKKECKDEAKCDKQDCKKVPCPFAELNLTAEQQTKIQALREEMQQQRQAKCEELKADREKARKEGLKCAKEARSSYLKKVKEILTPEQYVQFLENSYLNAKPEHQKRPRLESRHEMHHGDKAQCKDHARKLGQRPGENRQ
ncbi:MAG: hypothetical protein K2L96_01800 [Muribaculaceae bacterium]|nr:hypothetical protein [Muribaculaceae bacterium]